MIFVNLQIQEKKRGAKAKIGCFNSKNFDDKLILKIVELTFVDLCTFLFFGFYIYTEICLEG